MPTSSDSKARWAKLPTPPERAAELERDERLATRDIRHAFALTLLSCAFWLLAGLALMGWALHTTDPGYGQIAFLAGLIVGYAGIVITLARYYLRGTDAGWW